MKQTFGLVRRPWGIASTVAASTRSPSYSAGRCPDGVSSLVEGHQQAIAGRVNVLARYDLAFDQALSERFAQQALGHNSKAVHRAYAKHAEVTVPSLADWEKDWQDNPQRSVQSKLLAVDFRSPLPLVLQSN